MLIYASRTATRSLQFKVHGRLSVTGMAVSVNLLYCGSVMTFVIQFQQQ